MESAMKDVLETMIAAANAGGAILRDRFQHLRKQAGKVFEVL